MMPFVVRWPGKIKPGSSTSAPSYFPDWFPTFCAIAKTTAPKGLDGTDLTPALTKGIFKRSKPMIWEFHGYSGQLAVIDFPWKAVRQKAKTKKPGDWQLYNLEKDAAETNDLAAKLPKIVNRLEKVFKNDRTKSERNKLPLYDLVKQK
jgi:arylsulfatase